MQWSRLLHFRSGREATGGLGKKKKIFWCWAGLLPILCFESRYNRLYRDTGLRGVQQGATTWPGGTRHGWPVRMAWLLGCISRQARHGRKRRHDTTQGAPRYGAGGARHGSQHTACDTAGPDLRHSAVCSQARPRVGTLCTQLSFDSVHCSESLFWTLFMNTIHKVFKIIIIIIIIK